MGSDIGSPDGGSPIRPPEKVKQGGWGDDGGGPKGGRRRAGNEPVSGEMVDDDRLHMEAPTPDPEEDGDSDDSDDDGIPVIQSLEQAAEEDLTMKMADAPDHHVAVTNIDDLNRDLTGAAPPFTQTESGIDLKLLTKVLNPPSLIQEVDRPMDFSHMFTAIKSELQTEKDEKERLEAAENHPDDEVQVAGLSGL